jgi:hypothetical protein
MTQDREASTRAQDRATRPGAGVRVARARWGGTRGALRWDEVYGGESPATVAVALRAAAAPAPAPASAEPWSRAAHPAAAPPDAAPAPLDDDGPTLRRAPCPDRSGAFLVRR